MTRIEQPEAWILRLFEMEEREGRGSDCVRFPEGGCPTGLPLEAGERVYGIYKKKYHFTANSLIILDRGKSERICWADVRSCSSQHGEGKTFSELTLADGRMVRVRVADMAKGWSGRISQLYHQMIERHGHGPAFGRALMSPGEFFEKAIDDYCIAPNLEPHPPIGLFRDAIRELERPNDGTRVLMDLVPEDDELVVQAMVIVSPRPSEYFQPFAELFGADGVLAADERTIRRVGQVPKGMNVWQVICD